MTHISTLDRILLFVVSLLLITEVSAKTTTWQGGAGNWSVSASWSDGLPALGDSAIISGVGSDVIFPNGLIATIEYLEVKSGATLLIESGSILAIKNDITYGLYLNDGTVTVQGLLSIPKSDLRGIHAISASTVINEGKIVIDSTYYGISLSQASSLENTGDIIIENSSWGIIAISESTVENDGLIDITKCAYSIDIRHVCYFENRDSVCVRDGSIMGLKSYGEVVNNGYMSIANMDGPGDYAILNDSFGCCDTAYIGTMTNNGMIEITNSEGDGLVCQPSTTFFNFGEMYISDCAQRGILLEPLARLRVEDGGMLTVSSSDAPLDVGDESNFVVRLGGTFDASIIDGSN